MVAPLIADTGRVIVKKSARKKAQKVTRSKVASAAKADTFQYANDIQTPQGKNSSYRFLKKQRIGSKKNKNISNTIRREMNTKPVSSRSFSRSLVQSRLIESNYISKQGKKLSPKATAFYNTTATSVSFVLPIIFLIGILSLLLIAISSVISESFLSGILEIFGTAEKIQQLGAALIILNILIVIGIHIIIFVSGLLILNSKNILSVNIFNLFLLIILPVLQMVPVVQFIPWIYIWIYILALHTDSEQDDSEA